MKIVVDIGHARGTGARGNGKEEHAVVGDIAAALADKLATRGHEVRVVDFPDKDNRADLVATVREINSLKPDFSISLHADAAFKVVGKEWDKQHECWREVTAPDPAPHGGHVCYFPGSQKGIQLARAIAWHLVGLVPGRAERTVARRDLYVLKNTVCPAVLVECGFITHPGDCELMVESPSLVAEAIAAGVEDYVKGGSHGK